MTMPKLLLVVVFFLMSFNLYAKEIEGVNISEQISLSNNTKLVLNGAGIRSKFIFDIYIGALYLEHKQSSAKAVINDAGAKRVMMHFLYDDVGKDKITKGWTEGFRDNNNDQQFKQFEARLKQFNDLFTDTHKGDEIRMDYIPSSGTTVWINGKLRGAIEGQDFNSALLKVWLGDDPADSDLKDAMLGKIDD